MASMAVGGETVASGRVECAIGCCAHDIRGSFFKYDVVVFR